MTFGCLCGIRWWTQTEAIHLLLLDDISQYNVRRCGRLSSMVCRLGRSVAVISCAKTAELNEMLFELRNWVGPRNHVLDEENTEPSHQVCTLSYVVPVPSRLTRVVPEQMSEQMVVVVVAKKREEMYTNNSCEMLICFKHVCKIWQTLKLMKYFAGSTKEHRSLNVSRLASSTQLGSVASWWKPWPNTSWATARCRLLYELFTCFSYIFHFANQRMLQQQSIYLRGKLHIIT